jgi:predicted lactoylglutathione lyase
MAKLYINLPVENLSVSITFYQALGFVQNLDFSDEKAAAMTIDDSLSVMLLSKDFFSRFVPVGKSITDSHQATEVLNALELESREAVDAIFDQAISAWGKKTVDTYDYWFMYGRDFEDPDGHIWEAFWMDVSQMPKA